ncbi:hypothetical protein MD484_g9013, partial [Candolleomyces efflorescens]
MPDVPRGGIWILNLPGGASWRFTPSAPIRITNACLGFKLDGNEERACLEYSTEPGGKPTAIASFTRHACERAELDLDLEVGETYVLTSVGPFQIDLMGFYLYEEPQADLKQDAKVATGAKKRGRPSGKTETKKALTSVKPPLADGHGKTPQSEPDTSTQPAVAFPAHLKSHPASLASLGQGGPVTRQRSRSAALSEVEDQANDQGGFFYNKGKEKA